MSELESDMGGDASGPVRVIAGDAAKPLNKGMALCLSGGGYRAMLFHLGSLWRLNELGKLSQLKRVSSVSGGSITAAVLGLAWKRGDFQQGPASRFVELVATPIRELASRSIDAKAILGGVFLPGSVSDWVTGEYRKHLFGDATLQDLPTDDEGPRFILNATNVQSGALWRFSRPYMGDYRVGLTRHPLLSVATAVAASSAFPPVLSPLDLDLSGFIFDPATIGDLKDRVYRQRAVLTDGGVYDNLGIETAWKHLQTVLVSDAGQKMLPEMDPDLDWAQHSIRVLSVVDNQVRSLRKRALMTAFLDKLDAHDGAYWSIAGPIQAPVAPGGLACSPARVSELAAIPTRLKRLDDPTQERLINWGHAACDAVLRNHFEPGLPAAPACPYPSSGI